MYTRTNARLLPRFFSILIGLFFTFWHPESAQMVEKMQNRRQFCQKNLFILFWPIIVCGRGSTSETHKEVRFLNGSEASGKMRYRDSQRPMRGKAHAGKTSYAYSYVRTCAHAHMGTCHVRTYMRQTTVPRRVTVSRRLVETSAWENIICVLKCVHAHMCTCVYAYVRTHARTYACAHVLDIWVRVWFFFPAWAFPRIGLRVAIPSRVAWVAVPQFTAYFWSTACFWSSLCAWVCVSLVLSRMYAHMSMRIGLSQREPSHA